MKKCAYKPCGTRVEPDPFNSMAKVWCSGDCKILWLRSEQGQKAFQRTRNRQDKDKRAEKRAEKIRLKSRGKWLDEAQAAFNKWIRNRDKDQPCISCGNHTATTRDYRKARAWQAGHFRSIGGFPELRFDEDNVHKECLKCNCYDSNHLEKYRANLVLRIGIERVESLEGPHPPQHWSIDDIKEIKLFYQKLNRENLKKSESQLTVGTGS